MTLERDSEDRFVRYVESLGFKAWKLRIDGQDGFPDRTVVTSWGTVYFEFKRPGQQLRARQWKVIADLRQIGASVFVSHSFQEAKEQLDEWTRVQSLSLIHI